VFSYKDNGWRFYFIFAINASNFDYLKALTLYLSGLGVCLLRIVTFCFAAIVVYIVILRPEVATVLTQTILWVCVRVCESVLGREQSTLLTTLQVFLSEVVLVGLCTTLQRCPFRFILEQSHGLCILFVFCQSLSPLLFLDV
jgi:hypothetical protein